MVALRGFFDSILGHSKGVMISVGVLLGIAVAIALFFQHRDAQAKIGRNALFSAHRTLESELKALVPPAPPAANKGEKAPPPPGLESVYFQKLDVDSKFPETVKKLKGIVEQFGSSRAGFDAAVTLADLYFNHGENAKSETWYSKALVLGPPNTFEKAVVLSSLGYVQENSGKLDNAISFFDQAFKLGEASLKGDLLMALARCYEAMHNTVKARSAYEQILTDLPNTEYAKTAELLKAQLK